MNEWDEKPKRGGSPAVLLGVSLAVIVAAWLVFSLALNALGSANQSGVPVAGGVINTGDYAPITLNLAAQRGCSRSRAEQASIEGDLALNAAAFTSNCDAGSGEEIRLSGDGAWFYVDLGAPREIGQIVTTLFLDTRSAHTAYIASNDLYNWLIVYDELESPASREPRTLTLDAAVTARYVGFVAQEWGGLSAEMTLFAVLPAN